MYKLRSNKQEMIPFLLSGACFRIAGAAFSWYVRKKRISLVLSIVLCNTVLVCVAQHADNIPHTRVNGVPRLQSAGVHLQSDSVPRLQSDSIRQLREITVTEKLTKEIVPVQTLSGAALQALSVHSVADAIRYFAGVQIKDYGGIGGLKTVNIRSLGSQHVGVFYDGIELGNAQNGIVDLGRFSLDNMAAVSLYNGQKSNIFQSAKDYASSGSIYLTARIPEFDADKHNNYKATLKTGSFGIINPSILWEHQLTKNISSSFNAEYLYTTGRYQFSYAKKDGYDTTETRKNGDVHYIRIETGLYGKIKDGDWKAKVYFYNSSRGYPGAAVREVPGRFTHQDRQWDNNIFVQSSFRKTFTPWYSIQLNGKYANDYLHYLSDPRLDVTTMYVDNHYRQQEGYFSAANLFTILPFWSINASADVQYNTLNADLIDFVYPRRLTTLGALATSLTFNKVKLQASLLGTFVHETTKLINTAATDKHEYTPSIIFGYKPWQQQDLDFRAFYKRIFRVPTLNDLYYTFIGNRYLEPEFTTQYDAGFTYSKQLTSKFLRGIGAQVDVYYNQVKNKIVAMPTSNQFRWTMLNLGYVEIRGLDASLQGDWLLGKTVSLNTRFSYTYQKAQDFTDKTSPYAGGQIPYIPWHSGSAVVNLGYHDWSVNYSYIYTGKRYEAVANIPENYSKPWYTHDISVSRNLKIKKTSLRLAAEINNLFNQQYEVVQWYPMPGTNYKLITSITL